MSKSLAGKTALSTGSTSGIGLAYAKLLAGEGANIVINGFGDADAIEKERLELESLSGAKALYSGHDLTKADEIEAMMVQAAEAFGGVDILTNNAGTQHVSPVEDFPVDKWSAYVTAKHGLAGFTKTVALEVATFGITANCISPGYVWTPLVENQIPDTMKARGMTREQVMNDVLLAGQPTKEFVTVEQVAAMALFLCSDAAANITGANMSIDGGWTAQ